MVTEAERAPSLTREQGRIADRLAAAMAAKNINQSELARLVGITPGAIQQAVAGTTKRSRFLPEIARHLDVTVDWLIGDAALDRAGALAISSVADALGAFEIDGYRPLVVEFGAVEDTLREAHGLTKVLATAYADASNANGGESDLHMLNSKFVASAFEGVGKLIALAMFMQEQSA